MRGDMPTVPKKSLEFALLLILAQFCAYMYQPRELRVYNLQNPFKPAKRVHFVHPRSAVLRFETRCNSFLRILRTVITPNRCHAKSFTNAGCCQPKHQCIQ